MYNIIIGIFSSPCRNILYNCVMKSLGDYIKVINLIYIYFYIIFSFIYHYILNIYAKNPFFSKNFKKKIFLFFSHFLEKSIIKLAPLPFKNTVK